VISKKTNSIWYCAS